MSVLAAIADELPLLAAVAHELGDDGNEVARLRVARQLLGDVLSSLDHTPGNRGRGSLNNRRRRRSGPRRREVMKDARRKTKAQAVQG